MTKGIALATEGVAKKNGSVGNGNIPHARVSLTQCFQNI